MSLAATSWSSGCVATAHLAAAGGNTKAAANEQPQSPMPSVHKSNRNKDRNQNKNNNKKNNINNTHKNRSNNTVLKHNQ